MVWNDHSSSNNTDGASLWALHERIGTVASSRALHLYILENNMMVHAGWFRVGSGGSCYVGSQRNLQRIPSAQPIRSQRNRVLSDVTT